MNLAPRLNLIDGHSIPRIGLGTWPMNDTEVADTIDTAIDLGYRLFDSAVNYGNEAGVGEGIRKSGIPREEVSITTKVPGRHHGYEAAKRSLDESLTRMKLDYVDLYLIHWPNPKEDKYVDTWRAFVDLQKEGKVRSIGVSNFKPSHIDRLVDETGVTPAVNQIQLYPAVSQDESRAYHQRLGIITESWSPLGLGANRALFGGSKTFLDLPEIVETATAHGRTPAQVVLRWHVQQGLVPLPKSSNEQRLKENLDVFSFELTTEEMSRLSSLNNADITPADSDQHEEF